MSLIFSIFGVSFVKLLEQKMGERLGMMLKANPAPAGVHLPLAQWMSEPSE